jgi:hypothetical protein
LLSLRENDRQRAQEQTVFAAKRERAAACLFFLLFDVCDRISSLMDFVQEQAAEPGKKATINETSDKI